MFPVTRVKSHRWGILPTSPPDKTIAIQLVSALDATSHHQYSSPSWGLSRGNGCFCVWVPLFLASSSTIFAHSIPISQFSGKELWEAIRGADLRYLSAAVFLIYLCYFLRALRWRNFQTHVGDANLFHILNMTLAGFSAVFLFGRVGEPVRPLLISRKDKIPLADTFGIYALERLIDMGFSVGVLGCWFLIATFQKFLHPDQLSPALESARKTAGTILTLGLIGFIALACLYPHSRRVHD